MKRRQMDPVTDPYIERSKQILADPAFTDDALREEYRSLAEAYQKTFRVFMKTIRISDGFQLRLKELNAALDQAMRTDYLTGLLNRRALFERIRPETSRARRHEQPLCILMADIDHFKLVNDSFGHDIGDHVLKEAARIFTTSLRAEDLKARWGGEEFLAFLPETGLEGAAAAAENLRVMIEQTTVAAPGGVITITLSIGVAEGTGEDPEKAIRAADQALLEAKRTGRNRVVVAPRTA